MHKENLKNQTKAVNKNKKFTSHFCSSNQIEKGQNRGSNQTFANCTIKAMCASD